MWYDERHEQVSDSLRVAIDFEFVVSGRRAVPFEMGACDLDSKLTFHALILPDVRNLPPCPTAPHLSWTFLESHGAMSPAAAFHTFARWLTTLPHFATAKRTLLCAHNAFVADAPIVAQLTAGAAMSQPLPQLYMLDTLAYCRFAFRGEGQYGLPHLSKQYLARDVSHSAQQDALDLSELIHYARCRRDAPLAGLLVPVGSTPLTLVNGVGTATAQMLMALNVPAYCLGEFLHYVRMHGWPPGLSELQRQHIEALLDEYSTTSDIGLRRLISTLTL